MARHLGSGWMTVVRHLQAPTFPERQGRHETGKSLLTPAQERLLPQWNARGRAVRRLCQDLQPHGSTGSDATVAREAPRLRHAQGLPPRE